MNSPQQVPPPSPRRLHWVIRAALTVATALTLAWLCGAAMRADAKLTSPPGLFRGMLHGAMMPIAWPTLLAGQDQVIYAALNEGRVYKLGYSMGVNLSGMVFFGWFFVSLSALRRKPAPPSASAP
jgi:hypothetical protein